MNILENLPEDIIKKLIIDYVLKERNGMLTAQIEKKKILYFQNLYNLIPKCFAITTLCKDTTLIIPIKNTRKRLLFGSSYERTGYIYKIYENGTILASCL